jgi:hypothetical protein
MTQSRIFFGLLLALVLFFPFKINGQSVPLGMNYQAVARDESGNELSLKSIEVKFTILSGSPAGTEVYQELHPGVITSRYGVFNLIIGQGTKTDPSGPDISQVPWEQANHWLKVEIDFGRGFINMGTMQFMAVPYAMFAYKSLLPGPQGPKGDPGDPASDNQTLSFDGKILTIANGNAVDLGSLNVPHSLSIMGDTLSILGGNKVGLPNQIQDLTLDAYNILKITNNPSASSISLTKYLDNTDSQTLLFNSSNNNLSITGGNFVDLTPMKQNLSLNGNILTITNVSNPVQVDLTKYLDNTDSQNLSFNSSSNILSISGGTSADLTLMKQNLSLNGNILTITNISNPVQIDLTKYLDNTDNQQLSYNPSTYTLSLTNGGSAVLGSFIAFRARKTTSDTGLSFLTDYDFIPSNVDYNDASGFDGGTGVFTAPSTGIYTFNVGFTATGSGDARALKLNLNGGLYEILNSAISSNTSFTRSVTMKLFSGDKVKVIINTGTSSESGTGSFSGFRVY